MTELKVGDTVAVQLPDGEFIGKIQDVKHKFMWTDDTWYEVSGNKPKPFITNTRNPRKVEE